MLYIQDQQYKNVIYPHVQVNDQDVAGKTEEEVIRMFEKDKKEYESITLQVLYEEQPIATYSGKDLSIETNIRDKARQAYLIGRTEHLPTQIKQKLEVLLGMNTYHFDTEVRYNTKLLDELIAITSETYYRAPVNAKFGFEDGKVTSFSAHRNGQEINKELFNKEVTETLQAIARNPQDKVITIQNRVLEPEITLAKTNDLGIEELVGEGKSDYSGSSVDRIYNLKLAASKFNGVIIPPGEEFSFNRIVGDISASTGYRSSYIIKNGKTVLGDGGGVCQVSTTAFRAALNTGLPIVERHAHAYRVTYYENDAKPGFDATIYTPTVDLRFKNDTPSNILIQTEIIEEENLLTFKFYGKKDNRKVEISEAEVWDVLPPPEPKYQDDPNLPKGTVKQVDYAAWGAKSRFTYKVTKDDKVMHEEEFYSSFRPWQAVFLVGQKE